MRFLMQDAQAACAAAAKQCFPEITILMCWFHLKQNIKKRIPDKLGKHAKTYKDMIEKDVVSLHYSNTYERFIHLKMEIFERWSQIEEMNDFKQYFEKQWLEGHWINWPLFTRPPGFSTTNNNTEGFNKTIKNIYTNYERSTILEGCNVIKRMVTDLIKFDYSLKRDNSLIVKADELILSDFSMIDSLSAYRIVNNENKYYI
ncbi:Carbonic anhydrase 2 [Brachionus plicatilis]|uniref:Carbonic anhydrase 2 n=1 Tax=Brachionus plicatilis TaxID=10195 RepID=A0A3M7R0C3_BRAPC|nr:Carbonic anhydrase 2 [Brachionus plicatilis]